MPPIPFSFHGGHRNPGYRDKTAPRYPRGSLRPNEAQMHIVRGWHPPLYYIPLISTPNIIRLLHDFGCASVLKVNMTKSVALNTSTPRNIVDRLKDHFPFSWNPTSIPYLGINLTSRIDQLYKYNYPPMFKKLTEDLIQWSLYKMSWLGRINSVKMTLLPRILYLFRSLPIPVTKLHIQNLQSAITHFMWDKKGHWLSKDILFRPRTKGGLGLPNLWWYYQAAQLNYLP